MSYLNNDGESLLRLRKADYLSDAPVYSNRVTIYTKYSEEQLRSQLHWHEFVELSVVIAGKGVHCTLQETVPCNPGDMYIINVGVPHAYFATEDGDCPTVCNLLFDPHDIFDDEAGQTESEKYCYGIFKNNPLVVYLMITSNTLDEVIRVLNRIDKELSNRKVDWRIALKSYLVNLLIATARYLPKDINEQNHHSLKEHLMVLSVIRTVMEQYGNQSMTLESIADSMYISKSTLCRVFKRVTGESFSDYVRRVRMDGACRLLRNTNLTNEQIVYRCGLKDIPSFYHLFKSQISMTPYEYRKKYSGIEVNDITMNRVTTSKTIQSESITKNINERGDKNMSTAIINEISENLQRGKAKVVKELVQNALDEGISADVILNEGLLAGMNIVGEKFKNNEVYVPEVLVAARAMNMGTQILKPHLAEAGVKATGKVCIGTVQGDLHDIGKNLVKMMLEGKGLEVIDLGTDVSPETFVQTAIDEGCQVICCSALLTTTMGVMEEVVNKAVEAGIRDKVKIMVGGAPVNEAFCEKIGADLYTPDAASAADAAVEFCKG